MKTITCLTCLALLAGFSSRAQIAAWDFYGQSAPISCTATTFNTNLVASGGMNSITRGAGAPASGGVHSFRTTGFQNNGISVSATDYFQVTLQALPGFKISLSSLDAKFNGTTTFFASPGVSSQFAYSLDGVNFILIGNPVQTTSLTYPQLDLTGIQELQNIYSETILTLRYYASGQTTTGGWGFYSGSPGTNGLAIGGTVTEAFPAAPSLQASEINFSNIQQTRIGLSWTPGNGEKRVVKINTINSFSDPVDGTDPSANPVYSGSGEQVVYNYSGSDMAAVSGLATGVTYWFRIYEYNGSGPFTMFYALPAINNPNSHATSAILLAPSISSPTFASVTSGSAILGGHITDDGGSPVIERGTVWNTTSPVAISDHKLPEGHADTGSFSALRTMLPPANQIYFAAYASNAVGTTMTPESFFYTLAPEPPTQVSAFTAVSAGTTSIELNWDPVMTGSDGYLILKKAGGQSPAGSPADATQYAPGSAIGDGIVAANINPGTTGVATITGLSPGTPYAFTIFPYAWNGNHAQTINYLSDSPIPSASAITGIPPVAIYHWTGASGIDWTVAGNWYPSRNIPALNDILIFDAGGSWTITNVPVQTIGQLQVAENTSITLQGAGTLSIAGDTGEDLVVPSGCQLNISGSNALGLTLETPSTGIISGEMTLSGAGHRMIATSANALVFASGSTFKTGSGFSGNPFGTQNLNSVIFNTGSIYICQAGGNPFGAAAPASVAVFQPGSLFRLDAYAVPSFGGRIYGNFEMNYPGSITVTGSSAVSINNFTATQGTFYFNMTGSPGHSIKGNVAVAHAATVIFSPATAGTVLFNGITPQTISGTGALMAGQYSTIVCSNDTGVKLAMNATLNNLTITENGLFTIAPNTALTVNGNLVNGAPASGLIIDTDGSMIHTNEGVPATVMRNIPGANWTNWQDGWHFLSSPVTGQAINADGGFITDGEDNGYDLYVWLEPDNLWVNYKNTSTPPLFSTVNGGNELVKGSGYLAAYQQTGNKSFTGMLNVSDVTVTDLSITGTTASSRGWHLLGNPFPCALTWYTDWITSNIGGVAYIWNEAGQSYTPRNPGEAIPACNGFMVQVMGNPGNSGSLTIPVSRRIHDTQKWFKESDYPVIKLIARNIDQPSFQECQLRFNPQSTTGFDPEFDGRFRPGYAPWFYSVCGEEKLAVNSLPAPEDGMYIPFCFEKNDGMHFQIEAQFAGEISAMVFLVDLKKDITHNLAHDPIYEFTSEENDPPGRFGITFLHVGMGEHPREKTQISVYGNDILMTYQGTVRTEVFGITGKLMVSKDLKGSGSEIVVTDAPPGWYLVRITAGNKVKVVKVFIHS